MDTSEVTAQYLIPTVSDRNFVSFADYVAPYLRPAILVDAGAIVLPARNATYVVVEGFCGQAIRTGGRRHIVGLRMAGDVLDLGALLGRRYEHQIVAMGPVRLAALETPDITSWIERNSALAELMLSEVLRDEAISRSWLHRLAALDAPHRVAHLLCELRHRLYPESRPSQVLRTPFTQTDIADLCGISAIHANRALAIIREKGLGMMRRGDFYAESWAKLEEFAQFDPGYLKRTSTPAHV